MRHAIDGAGENMEPLLPTLFVMVFAGIAALALVAAPAGPMKLAKVEANIGKASGIARFGWRVVRWLQ